MAEAVPRPSLTLDEAREFFYVAQRSCERYVSQLAKLVAELEQKKVEDGWLEQVQLEATKAVHFYEQQHNAWSSIKDRVDSYIDTVKDLGEQMAIAEIKGEALDEADLPENKAKTVHPELLKFKLEKQARILGKVGGVPALGPGGMPVVPRGHILKATATPAAREIQYSKVENKDAAQLAGVFQFKKHSSEVGPAAWQAEAKEKRVRAASEAMASEIQRMEEQQEMLKKAGTTGAELAAALQSRANLVKKKEEEEAAAHASEYRRTRASNDDELQDATAELADKLKRRQEEVGRQLTQEQQEALERQEKEEGKVEAWSNKAAPFGGELAALLQKRASVRDAAEKAGPVRSSTSGTGANPMAGLSGELGELLRKRQSRLQQSEQSEQEQ